MAPIAIALGLCAALLAGPAFAGPTLRLGPREAALRIDRRATFDALVSGTTILYHREDGLEFSFGDPAVPQRIYIGAGPGVMRPYLYGNACSHEPFISIRGVDGAAFTDLEMTVASGGPSYARWETYRNQVLTGSGTFHFDPATFVGLSDRETFDSVRIAADSAPIPEGWAERNCVYLDNVFATVASDGDADGLLDDEDACPGSETGAPVDAEGCTLAQACGAISAEGIRGRFACLMRDWLDDEPGRLFPDDCRPRHRRGGETRCEAR
jgi:hypothetical protein